MTNTKDFEKNNIFYSPVQNKGGDSELENNVPTIGIRHWQTLLYFMLVLVGFGFRVILSVGIVAMTDPKASINPNVPTYNWTDKNVILSAFFWGYIIPQMFAGYAANKFGAKWFLISTMMVQSILSLLLPFTAAQFGSKGLCGIRAMQGFCQGFIFPSVAQLLSQWAPKEERSRLGSFAIGAGSLGTVIAIPITGLISASWYGWPVVFYLYGGLGTIWSILFALFGYNTPAEHPNISEAEKYYIEKSLGHTDEKPSHKVPWKEIFTSIPLLALFVVQSGNNYCFWTLLTQIPTYMNCVMNFNIKDNGILSALPYLTFWVLTFVFSFTSDFIINKNLISIGTSRKTFTSIGLLLPAITLISLGFTRADQSTQAVILLIISVGFNSACLSGWAINHLDLSPNHAGTLMGITNGFANIPALLAPLTVQFLVIDETNPLEWRVVFFLAAGINITVTIFYILFGSGEVQPWNDDSEEETRKTTEKSHL